MTRPSTSQPPVTPPPAEPGDERRLRDFFAALREEDRRALPGFERMLAEARVRTGDDARVEARRPRRALPARPWLWLGAAAFAVMVVAVAFHLRPARAPEPASLDEAMAIARSIDAWKAPTDALPEISYLKIPDTVPSLEITSVTLPALTTKETQ